MTKQGEAVRNYPKIVYQSVLNELDIGIVGELAERTTDKEQAKDTAISFLELDQDGK